MRLRIPPLGFVHPLPILERLFSKPERTPVRSPNKPNKDKPLTKQVRQFGLHVATLQPGVVVTPILLKNEKRLRGDVSPNRQQARPAQLQHQLQLQLRPQPDEWRYQRPL